MMKFNFNIVFVAFILITCSIVSTKSQSMDCNAFIDNLGVFNQPQSCSMLGKFCCGSCSTVRFCCDDPLYALNQTTCPHSPSQNAKTSSPRQNTVSYQYIITVDNTIYWIKICVIVVPLFIFVVLLSIVFVLCANARKARRQEAQLIYSFDPQLGRLPRPITGAQIYTIPSTLSEAPKYETLKKSALPIGAVIIQPEELPKYDDLKRF